MFEQFISSLTVESTYSFRSSDFAKRGPMFSLNALLMPDEPLHSCVRPGRNRLRVESYIPLMSALCICVTMRTHERRGPFERVEKSSTSPASPSLALLLSRDSASVISTSVSAST